MQVRDLSIKLDTSVDTVRYYVRIGLVKPTKNPENGYWIFSHSDMKRLRFIIASRHLGFSIADIKKILKQADQGNTPCPTVKKVIELRLAETEKKFQEIVSLRNKMKQAMKSWKDKPDISPDGNSICHLIENFNES
jgi:DNA-binding transcriptional MerR regulator